MPDSVPAIAPFVVVAHTDRWRVAMTPDIFHLPAVDEPSPSHDGPWPTPPTFYLIPMTRRDCIQLSSRIAERAMLMYGTTNLTAIWANTPRKRILIPVTKAEYDLRICPYLRDRAERLYRHWQRERALYPSDNPLAAPFMTSTPTNVPAMSK